MPSLSAISFKTISNFTLSADFGSMDDFYQMVSKSMEKSIKQTPPPSKDFWFTSLLNLYSLQSSLASGFSDVDNFWKQCCSFDTMPPTHNLFFFQIFLKLSSSEKPSAGVMSSLLLSVGLSVGVLLLTTWDVAIMISAALTIASASLVTVASLVLMGWELNMFESMTLSLAVGLSIDFAIHLGVAFKMTKDSNQGEKRLGLFVSALCAGNWLCLRGWFCRWQWAFLSTLPYISDLKVTKDFSEGTRFFCLMSWELNMFRVIILVGSWVLFGILHSPRSCFHIPNAKLDDVFFFKLSNKNMEGFVFSFIYPSTWFIYCSFEFRLEISSGNCL